MGVEAWILVPARGGSKSIPRKNLVELENRPLIEYGIRAAQAARRPTRIFCSTDDSGIADCARTLGCDISERPPELSTDDAKVDRVAQAFVEGFPTPDRPDVVVLVQPTSPFVLPRHIDDLIAAFDTWPDAASIHNAVPVSHNSHAWNQRTIGDDGRVRFLMAEERRRSRNKQEKPALHIFGNLVGARTSALLAGEGFYAEPVYAVDIDAKWAFDLDGPEDIEIGRLLLASGYVQLDHLESGPGNEDDNSNDRKLGT